MTDEKQYILSLLRQQLGDKLPLVYSAWGGLTYDQMWQRDGRSALSRFGRLAAYINDDAQIRRAIAWVEGLED